MADQITEKTTEEVTEAPKAFLSFRFPFLDPEKNNNARRYAKVVYWGQRLITLICIGLCFAPFAKIGDISMGNAYQLAIELMSPEKVSTQYLSPRISGMAIATIVVSFLSFFIRAEHVNKKVKIKQAGWLSFFISLGEMVIILAMVYCWVGGISEYYGCRIVIPYIVAMLIMLPDALLCFISSIYLTVHKTGDGGRLAHEATPKISKKRRAVGIASCALLVAIPVGLFGYGVVVQPTSVIKPYTNCEVDSTFEAGLLVVGESYSFHNYVIDREKNLIIDMSGDSSIWREEAADNVLYYEALIKELREEKNALKPKEVSSNDESAIKKSMEKYLEKLAQLEAEIKYLSAAKESLPSQYAVVELGPIETQEVTTSGYPFYGNTERRTRKILSYTHNRNKNYCDENGKKWGYSDGSLASMIFGEKIILSSRTFTADTDFLTEKIIATVSYSDGSKRVSIITPTNAAELNEAQQGQHYLKWSDSWGEYEALITIGN